MLSYPAVMNRNRRKLIFLTVAIVLGGVAWYADLFRAGDCVIQGGRWNWGGHFCRLDQPPAP